MHLNNGKLLIKNNSNGILFAHDIDCTQARAKIKFQATITPSLEKGRI